MFKIIVLYHIIACSLANLVILLYYLYLIFFKDLPPSKPEPKHVDPNIPHKKSRFSESWEAAVKGEDDPEARFASNYI